MNLLKTIFLALCLSASCFAMENEIIQLHDQVKSQVYVRNGGTEKKLREAYMRWFEGSVSLSLLRQYQSYVGDLCIVAEATFWLKKLMESEINEIFSSNPKTFDFSTDIYKAKNVNRQKVLALEKHLLLCESEELVQNYALQQASFIIGRPQTGRL